MHENHQYPLIQAIDVSKYSSPMEPLVYVSATSHIGPVATSGVSLHSKASFPQNCMVDVLKLQFGVKQSHNFWEHEDHEAY